ncbi:MAG TPA: hypothetical protein VMW72_03295 [Sedimentisphaerales bacterium]|nr:hypothetical protein [Sedimentisphaerales bacterium]
MPKAFLAQQTGESAGNIDTTIKYLDPDWVLKMVPLLQLLERWPSMP